MNEAVDEGPELIKEEVEEQATVKALIEDRWALAPTHTGLDATFKKLIRNVDTLIQEETKMLPLAERAMAS